MRHFAGTIMALAALAMTAAYRPAAAEVAVNPSEETVHVDACVNDPDKLGISRIVEVDAHDGPVFGGSHGKGNEFLRDGEVVLTFDDGPHRAYTGAVLKALEEHCTKATFFMVGRMAAADPEMVKTVAAAGHTIGTHTWSHKNLGQISLANGQREFERANSMVAAALGAPVSPFFRYPYLSASSAMERYAKSRNVATFWIDVDSKDYQSRDPARVQRLVMSQLAAKRKGIILMHDIQPSTAKGIKGLLDELHERGFRIVHVVAKASLETEQAYDQEAQKVLTARASRHKANPLAERSIVSAADSPSRSRVTAAKRAKPTNSPPNEVFPWTTPQMNSVGAAEKAGKKNSENLPWQLDIFDY